MKKCFIVLCMAAAVFMSLSIVSYAEEEDFWKDYGELVPGQTPAAPEDALSEIGADRLIQLIMDALGVSVGSAASFLSLVLGIAILHAVADSSQFSDGGGGRAASAVISAVSGVLIFTRLGEVISSVRGGLEELCGFFSGLIPIMTGILASGGCVNSAASQAIGMNLTLGTVSFLSESLLVPLVYSMLALSLASGLDGGAVASTAKWMRNTFNWLLGIMGAVVIGALSLQSVVSGAKDGAYLRAAKYAASGMIPVVGSTVSTALSTLAGGLAYVKGAVGASAVVALLSMLLTPLVLLLLYRAAISMAVLVVEAVGSHGGVRTFSAFRSAFDALISVYALVCVVSVAELVIFLKSGVDVFA